MTNTLEMTTFCDLEREEMLKVNGGGAEVPAAAAIIAIVAVVSAVKAAYDFGKEVGSDIYKLTH